MCGKILNANLYGIEVAFLNIDAGAVIGLPLIINSILLGVGLAMDAFSVSIANGLNEPSMRKGRVCIIAGVYSLFQFAMPLIGWFFVHSVAGMFNSFQLERSELLDINHFRRCQEK